VVACFSLFYVVTAFALGYGTATLGFDRADFLMVDLGAIVFWAIAIIIACWLSDRMDPEPILIVGCVGTIIASVLLAPMLGSGSLWLVFVYLAFALTVMGFVNGPLGAWLPDLFPARVRYSGTSLAFNVGGIIGGAFSPIAAQALAERSGLVAVGFYLAVTGGLSLIGFDASARRRAMSALQRSERRYRSIFEQNHVSLCEIDLAQLREHLEGLKDKGIIDLQAYAESYPAFFSDCAKLIRFTDVNDATVELLGCGSRDAILEPINRFLPAGSDLLPHLIFAVEAGAERLEREVRLLRADGREVIVLFILAFPDDQQAFDRVACAMIDVTEREQAKEALNAAQSELARAGRAAAVGAISASIAHEVNQPIGAVVMFAQACIRWLQASPPDIKAASNAADRVVQHSLRASQIIQRTREQLKGQKREPEVFDMKEAVAEVAALLERELAATSTRLVVDLPTMEALVIGDKVEIQQLFANLMTNAIHAMSAVDAYRREITIHAKSDGPDFLTILVRDRGVGITEENLAKLFNPFFTTKAEGMGMGLAICRTIAEAHGGSLSAGNHQEGGAVFEVLLPRPAFHSKELQEA
jgi:PAS domain S-box-containing protein